MCALPWLTSCTSPIGFQGGYIPDAFNGITKAEAVSPDSIRLAWPIYKGTTKYSIYSFGKNDPIYDTAFPEIIFKPDSPRTPDRVYRYSVTATSPETGLQVGNKANYVPISVLPRFNFRDKGAVSNTNSGDSLRVSWEGFPGVTYKIFAGEKDATGRVNYENFINAAGTVTGVSQTMVTGLKEGREYCFVAVALYADNTIDGPNAVPLSSETTLSTQLVQLSTGEGGRFNTSVVAQSQKCKRTTSGFDIGNIEVLAPRGTLSTKPTFRVEGVPDLGSTISIETSMYRINPNSDYAEFIGTRLGNGNIQSVLTHAPGKYQYYAIITKRDTQSTQAPQVRAEIKLESNINTTVDENNRNWIYVRNIGGTVNPNPNHCDTNPSDYQMDSGCYPEKQQLGMGPQRLGSAVAMGDFNCDGKYDLAIGISDYMTVAEDNRSALLGKVIIYYDVKDGTPVDTTKKQEIVFDLTSRGDSSRNLRLGTSLLALNINQDNGQTNQNNPSDSTKNFQCDDLIIGSGLGPTFVLYGKRAVGSDTLGGLNYSNSTTYSTNPASCDPTSNVCEAAVILGDGVKSAGGYSGDFPNNQYFKLDEFTSGDFNGDGYPDLAIKSRYNDNRAHSLWVYRGSEYGLVSPYLDNSSNCATSGTLNFATGSILGFPIISFQNWQGGGPLCSNTTSLPFSVSNAIGSMPNSGFDYNTQRVKDLFMVGANSSTFACLSKGASSGANYATNPTESKNTIQGAAGWDCNLELNKIPLSGTMASIQNALRYSSADLPPNGNNPAYPTLLGHPGALAISTQAKGSSDSGEVYVYYGLARPDPSLTPSTGGAAMSLNAYCTANRNSSPREFRGCLLNEYIKWLFTQNSQITSSTQPCPIGRSSTSPDSFEQACAIQAITQTSNLAGGFGGTLSVFRGNDSATYPSDKGNVLAVPIPFANITTGGKTFANVGSVQLYKTNSFITGNEGYTVAETSPSPSTIRRYSDGLSNNLTESINYKKRLISNIYFGLGGVAGGPTSEPISGQYDSRSDLIIGAPGYSLYETKNYADGTSKSAWISDNGATFTYFSDGSNYQPYRQDQNATQIAEYHEIKYNPSPENSLFFHQAIPVGDLNNDGATDFAVRITQGTKNKVRVYYGSPNGYYLSNNFVDIQVPNDDYAGLRIIPLGKIRAESNFPALMITGKYGSYIYFSGIAGLTLGEPTVFGSGGVPRKLPATPGSVKFSDDCFLGAEMTGDIESNLNSLKPFAVGDFNGDGYSDLAIATNSYPRILSGSGGTGSSAFPSGTSGQAITILYGGADNGYQMSANSSKKFLATEDFFSVLEQTRIVTTASPAPVPANPVPTRSNLSSLLSSIPNTNSSGRSIFPCERDGKNCRNQALFSQSGYDDYGRTLTSVPVGTCSGKTVHALVVSTKGPTTTQSSVEYYLPRCLLSGSEDMLSGLVPIPIRLAISNKQNLGTSMTYIDKTMGKSNPISGHLAISDSSWSASGSGSGSYVVKTYPVYAPIDPAQTGPLCSDNQDPSLAQSATLEPFSINSNKLVTCGAQNIDYSTSNLMLGHSDQYTPYDPVFAGSLVSPFDMNGDGFGDLVIGVTKLNRKGPGTITPAQGGMIVLFGGQKGLQAYNGNTLIEPSTDALCYKERGKSEISCNPTLVYLPQPSNSTRKGAYERLYISPFAGFRSTASSFNNLGSILLGAPYRDTTEDLVSGPTGSMADSRETQRILNSGVFYILK